MLSLIAPFSKLQVIMDAKDTTRRINRRPGWCALDERKESRSRTFSAVRDTRLPMDQLQTVARHPPVIMMQSPESGAPDPKAQSSNTSLATPSQVLHWAPVVAGAPGSGGLWRYLAAFVAAWYKRRNPYYAARRRRQL